MADTTTLLDGLYFGEGPRWHDGRLYVSDMYAHTVWEITEDGTKTAYVRLPGDGQPSGLGWLPDGRMLIVSMLDRTVLRREHDGTLVTHADLSAVATFHTNDMVVDAQGNAYVGNFGFDLDAFLHEHGIEGVLADPGPPQAVLALVRPDGSVEVVAEHMKFPNGAVITPDGKTLIIAETLGLRLTAFDIEPDATLSNRRLYGDLGAVAPDGICLNAEGFVWVANAIGHEVVCYAEEGEVVATVETELTPFACMLGGADGRTLFICTAESSVAAHAKLAPHGRIEMAELHTPHAGLP
jgi:sugar lactone lactonase YvrE